MRGFNARTPRRKGRETSNNQHRTPNVQVNVRRANHSMLDVRCWMFDVGCSMLDVGCWMLDVQCWVFNVGCFPSASWRRRLAIYRSCVLAFENYFSAMTRIGTVIVHASTNLSWKCERPFHFQILKLNLNCFFSSKARQSTNRNPPVTTRVTTMVKIPFAEKAPCTIPVRFRTA